MGAFDSLILPAAIIVMAAGMAAGGAEPMNPASPTNPAAPGGQPDRTKPAATPMIYTRGEGGFTRNIADGFFLRMLKENPKAVMGAIPQSVTQEWRVQYAAAEDGFKLAADLYYREKKPAQKRPAIIYVHGGAWVSRGALSAERQLGYFALTENVLGVAMFYRLAQEAHYPAAVQDLKCCIRWIHAIADDYAIDPNAIMLMGSSAGCHIALIAAATAGRPEFRGPNDWYKEQSDAVSLVLLQSPSVDPSGGGKNPNQYSIYVGGTLAEAPEKFRQADPLTYLNKNMPPVFMIQGDQDSLLEGTRRNYDKLQALGVPVELAVMPGRGHGMFEEDFLPQLEMMRAFINKHIPKY